MEFLCEQISINNRIRDVFPFDQLSHHNLIKGLITTIFHLSPCFNNYTKIKLKKLKPERRGRERNCPLTFHPRGIENSANRVSSPIHRQKFQGETSFYRWRHALERVSRFDGREEEEEEEEGGEWRKSGNYGCNAIS